MKKYLAEAFCTFTLVLVGCGAMTIDELGLFDLGKAGTCLVFGLTVMTLIYLFSSISGAHLNPAVTVGFYIIKKISTKDMLYYILFQIVGATIGALLLRVIFPESILLGMTIPKVNVYQAFIFEVIITMVLMIEIFVVLTRYKKRGVAVSITIGLTIALLSLFGGSTSGASMNPARSLGPAIAAQNFENIWIYLCAPLIGAVLAVPIFHLLQIDDAIIKTNTLYSFE